MMRLGSRQVTGLLVMALVLLSDAIAISHAIELERFFNAASSTFFGRMRKDNDLNSKDVKKTRYSKSTCTDPKKQPTSSQTMFSPSQPQLHRFHRAKPTAQKEKEQFCNMHKEQCKVCARASPKLLELRGGHRGHSTSSSADQSHDHIIAESLCAAHHTPYDIPLYIWKIIFQFVLTAMNVLCWYIPLKHKSLRENDLGLSLANSFSGGVFLSLAFGHLIPECIAGFPAGGYGETFPYMLILGGYLLIFFIEKVAFDVHVHSGGHDHDHSGLTSFSGGHGHSAYKLQNGATTDAAPSSGRSAVILLAALAVHSILEMVSLGLANSFGDAALLSLSIGLHQPAESIALLVAFLKSGMTTKQIITYLSVFSAMGPIGVALGMAVNQFATPLADACMLAVVAGTFVYVGATEVIPEEFESQEHKWKKLLALLSGIVSIFFITQYTMALEHH